MQLPSRLPNCPGRQVFKASACNTDNRGLKSHPGLQILQCSLIAKLQAHNLVDVGSTPTTATKCTDGVTATPQSPKLLFWVQILVCALPCPDRKSLHTRLMVRQLSLKQSMQVQFLCVNQQLF